ncbi:hypothetical protein Hanom_Chr11g00994731 [Helianthus anomalus]
MIFLDFCIHVNPELWNNNRNLIFLQARSYGSSQLFNFPPIFFQEYHRFPYYDLFLHCIYIYRLFYNPHILHLHILFIQSISEVHISLYKHVVYLLCLCNLLRNMMFIVNPDSNSILICDFFNLILLIWLKVHQGIFFQPWFLRLMNVADTVILVSDNLLHNFCFVLIKYSLLLLCYL